MPERAWRSRFYAEAGDDSSSAFSLKKKKATKPFLLKIALGGLGMAKPCGVGQKGKPHTRSGRKEAAVTSRLQRKRFSALRFPFAGKLSQPNCPGRVCPFS